MLKLHFECRIVAQDQDSGFWRRRVITGSDIYNFTVALATGLYEIMTDHGQYSRATEQDKMEEQSELPF
jgi:hypothetical protein